MELENYLKLFNKYNKITEKCYRNAIESLDLKKITKYMQNQIQQIHHVECEIKRLDKCKRKLVKIDNSQYKMILKVISNRKKKQNILRDEMERFSIDLNKLILAVEKKKEVALTKEINTRELQEEIERLRPKALTIINGHKVDELKLNEDIYKSCDDIIKLSSFLNEHKLKTDIKKIKKKNKKIAVAEISEENMDAQNIADTLIELSKLIEQFKSNYKNVSKYEKLLSKIKQKELFKDYVLMAGIGGIRIDLGMDDLFLKILNESTQIKKIFFNIKESCRNNIIKIKWQQDTIVSIITKSSFENHQKNIKEILIKYDKVFAEIEEILDNSDN